MASLKPWILSIVGSVSSAPLTVVNVNSSRALDPTDNGRVLNVTGALNLTANNNLPSGFYCEVVQSSYGQATFVSGTYTVVNSFGLTSTRGINSVASVRVIGTTVYTSGDMS